MLVVWVLLGIFALLFLLLLCPVSIRIRYLEEKLTVSGHYLFLSLPLLPPSTKERKPKRKKAEKEPEEEPPKKTLREQIEEWKKLIEPITDLVKSSKKATKTVKNHLIFYRIRAFALVGGEDAHQIGEEYGMHCIIISNAVGALYQFFHVKKPLLWVQPDFLATQSEYDISLRVRIRPLFLLYAGGSVGFQFLMRQLRKDKDKLPSPNNKQR